MWASLMCCMDFKQMGNDAKQRSEHVCPKLISYSFQSLTCSMPHPVVDVSGKRTAQMRKQRGTG